MPWWLADVISSLIFTLYHFPLWLARGAGPTVGGTAWVFIAGVAFGIVFWRTRSLGAAVLVHGLHNILLQVWA